MKNLEKKFDEDYIKITDKGLTIFYPKGASLFEGYIISDNSVKQQLINRYAKHKLISRFEWLAFPIILINLIHRVNETLALILSVSITGCFYLIESLWWTEFVKKIVSKLTRYVETSE